MSSQQHSCCCGASFELAHAMARKIIVTVGAQDHKPLPNAARGMQHQTGTERDPVGLGLSCSKCLLSLPRHELMTP